MKLTPSERAALILETLAPNAPDTYAKSHPAEYIAAQIEAAEMKAMVFAVEWEWAIGQRTSRLRVEAPSESEALRMYGTLNPAVAKAGREGREHMTMLLGPGEDYSPDSEAK